MLAWRNHGHELLLKLGVPVVLYIIIRPAWQLSCYDRPPEVLTMINDVVQRT